MTNLVSLKSMGSSLPRKLYGGSFTRYKANAKTSLVSFCTKSLSSAEREADSDSDCDFETACLSSSNQLQFTSNTERTLENGLDLGIYKLVPESSSRRKVKGNIDWAIGTGSHTKEIKEWDDSDLLKAKIS